MNYKLLEEIIELIKQLLFRHIPNKKKYPITKSSTFQFRG